MSMDVFDPAQHKIVAIDKNGRHLHVTLLELAMDMSAVDFAPFFARLRQLEEQAKDVPLPPAPNVPEIVARVLEALPATAVPDLEPLLERITALESRPAPVPSDPIDVSPLLEAVSHLSQRVAAVESRPMPSPSVPQEFLDRLAALEQRFAALTEHLIEQERVMQRVLQTAAESGHLIDLILDNGVAKDGGSIRKVG